MNLELTPSALLSNLRTSSSHYASLNHSLNEKFNKKHNESKSIRKILVAFSGGVDSHVLLHLLSRISCDEISLRAVYVNHGLQVQADDWAEHCQKICDDLTVPFKSIRLNADLTHNNGESLEEVARKARYEALYSELTLDEILITAHHQSDQAETLLLQLLRGAGVQGLAAMPIIGDVRIKGQTYLLFRPLLDQSRLALEAYAKEFELEHIEDPSNVDTSFDRNFLRQDVIPLLKKRWLGFDKALSRTAALQAETKTLLDEVAHQELPDVLSEPLSVNVSSSSSSDLNDASEVFAPILIPDLLRKSENKQRLLIRYWISQQDFLAPSAKKLQHIFSDVIHSSADKQPLITWKGVELRRFKQHLFIMAPLSEHDVTQIIPWQTDAPLYISSINTTLHAGLVDDKNAKVTIRFRQGGESMIISKRGKVILKNLLQEKQVPPWLRSRLPLIYIGDELVKIVGLTDYNSGK